MEEQFEVTEEAAQPMLTVRTHSTVANLPSEMGRAFGAVITYINEIGEETPGPAVAGYHNMDMENLDVEMGFPVAKRLPGKGEVQPSEIPAGKRVSYMYKGPYPQMESAYNALTEWMKNNGHVPTGMVYELYYNSPQEVPESELLTKIVFPLVK
jgi:effector-binding domain-containing protein